MFDYILFVTVILLAAGFIHFVRQLEWTGVGPLWPDLVAAVGAYAILLGGLAGGLLWRRYNQEP